MNLHDIIDAVADQADDFLAGADNRAQARAGIMELLNADYPGLTHADRKTVADRVMDILDREGFFESTPGGESEPD